MLLLVVLAVLQFLRDGVLAVHALGTDGLLRGGFDELVSLGLGLDFVHDGIDLVVRNVVGLARLFDFLAVLLRGLVDWNDNSGLDLRVERGLGAFPDLVVASPISTTNMFAFL